MPGSSSTPKIESDHSRIVRLEERLAWFEKHVAEQDRVMLDLSEQLARLQAELRSLRDRADSGSDGAAPEAKEPPPPHY